MCIVWGGGCLYSILFLLSPLCKGIKNNINYSRLIIIKLNLPSLLCDQHCVSGIKKHKPCITNNKITWSDTDIDYTKNYKIPSCPYQILVTAGGLCGFIYSVIHLIFLKGTVSLLKNFSFNSLTRFFVCFLKCFLCF